MRLECAVLACSGVTARETNSRRLAQINWWSRLPISLGRFFRCSARRTGLASLQPFYGLWCLAEIIQHEIEVGAARDRAVQLGVDHAAAGFHRGMVAEIV